MNMLCIVEQPHRLMYVLFWNKILLFDFLYWPMKSGNVHNVRVLVTIPTFFILPVTHKCVFHEISLFQTLPLNILVSMRLGVFIVVSGSH